MTGPTPAPPAPFAVWRLFLLANRLVTAELDAALQRQEQLSLTEYDVLMTVRAAPGGRLRLRELERTVLLTQSGVSRLVDRLAQHGLLDRCADPGDRRAVLVGLSAEGRRRLRRAKALAQTHVESAFLAHLDDRELAGLHAALDRVVAAARDRAAGPDDERPAAVARSRGSR